MMREFLKDERGQTDSVFKVALTVIIIAAVLAVVAVLMKDSWSGTQTIAANTKAAATNTTKAVSCLTTGKC